MNDRWRSILWDAVQRAVIAGTDPKEFKQELRECWEEALRQEAQHADKVLRDD